MGSLPPEVVFTLAGLGITQFVMFIILVVQLYRAPSSKDLVASVEECYGPESR